MKMLKILDVDYIHYRSVLPLLLPGNLSSLAFQPTTGISIDHYLQPISSVLHLILYYLSTGMLKMPSYCAIPALAGEKEKS